MKVLIAFLHYGPYHRARLAAAREAGLAEGVTVTGLEMARSQGEYAWTCEEKDELLCENEDIPLENVAAALWSTLLGPALNRVAPDLCAIAGYSHPAMLSLIALCAERGIPWILMSESQEIDEVRKPSREWMKSRIISLASSALAGGKPHLDYLAKLGLPASECEVGYDVIDNAYFASESAKWRQSESPPPPYFLASARFIPKKNLFRLLEAYADYARLKTSQKSEIRNPQSEIHNSWPLCLLGDGDLKSALLTHAADLGLTVIERAPWELQASNLKPETSNLKPETASAPPTVFLPGFRQIAELPRFYAHAGTFVHASTTEQWGLVVNEAMACELPVLVSDRCGCAPDLVVEGENGWTFDPTDLEGLAALMTKVAALPEADRAALGAASERLIADWGPERFASGLLSAARRALEVGPKRAGWLDRALLYVLVRR